MLAAVAWAAKLPVVTLGDLASIAGRLPRPHLPAVPLTLDAAAAVLPAAAALAAVGLIEALLAQQMMDEYTGARSATHVECVSQGVANVCACCSTCSLCMQTLPTELLPCPVCAH